VLYVDFHLLCIPVLFWKKILESVFWIAAGMILEHIGKIGGFEGVYFSLIS